MMEEMQAQAKLMASRVHELVKEGKSVKEIAAETGASVENVTEMLKRPTLEESGMSIVTTKSVLFMVLGDEGPLLVCGNTFTFDLIRTRWGADAKFWLIGSASLGMAQGVVGRFSNITKETFEGAPCV